MDAFALDAFAFEFMGLAMVALCLVVLALPSGRRPAKHVRYEKSGSGHPAPVHRSQARAESASGRRAPAESGALLKIQGQNLPQDP